MLKNHKNANDIERTLPSETLGIKKIINNGETAVSRMSTCDRRRFYAENIPPTFLSYRKKVTSSGPYIKNAPATGKFFQNVIIIIVGGVPPYRIFFRFLEIIRRLLFLIKLFLVE